MEEKEEIVGGLTLNAGVFEYRAAPTVIAAFAFPCPTMVEEPCLNSFIFRSPRKTTYLKRTVLVNDPGAAEEFTIMIFTTVSDVTSKGSTSMGSFPILFELTPNKARPVGSAR